MFISSKLNTIYFYSTREQQEGGAWTNASKSLGDFGQTALPLLGLSFLICGDLNEMILCSCYTCSLGAYYVIGTTLNPKGYKDEWEDIVPTFQALCALGMCLNNRGSLLHALKTLWSYHNGYFLIWGGKKLFPLKNDNILFGFFGMVWFLLRSLCKEKTGNLRILQECNWFWLLGLVSFKD